MLAKRIPPIRLLFSNFMNEVVCNRMEYEQKAARQMKCQLLSTMVGRELSDDDAHISPTFDISRKTWVNPFGTEPKAIYDKQSGGYHIVEQFTELPDGMDLLRSGGFGVDRAGIRHRSCWPRMCWGICCPPAWLWATCLP